jgi:hypothetical protein
VVIGPDVAGDVVPVVGGSEKHTGAGRDRIPAEGDRLRWGGKVRPTCLPPNGA